MQVPHPLSVARDVGAFRPDDPPDGPDRRAKHRPQRRSLGRGELRERLAVPPHLHDQLAGVGVRPGVVADQPQTIIMDRTAGRGDTAGHLFADAARRIGHAGREPR
jgi:hypothetical protein